MNRPIKVLFALLSTCAGLACVATSEDPTDEPASTQSSEIAAFDPKPIAIESLVQPSTAIFLTVPNLMDCGVTLSFADPPSAVQMDALLAKLDLDLPGYTDDVVATFDATSGKLNLTMPTLRAWSAELVIASKDHETTLADVFRAALGIAPGGSIGTAKTIVCSAPSP